MREPPDSPLAGFNNSATRILAKKRPRSLLCWLQSYPINRRSRCGSVRGCPVLSSHFSPGPAPQVGQRIACIFLRVVFLAFMTFDIPQCEGEEWSILHSRTRMVIENPDTTH